MSEFRYSRLKDNWVIIARERANRPTYFQMNSIFEKDIESSPFEAGREYLTPKEILKVGEPWKVRVVPNKFRAVSIENEPKRDGCGVASKIGGFGAHEVVIDTPNPNRNIMNFEADEFFLIFNSISLRIKDLTKDDRIAYVQAFKNHKKHAGATISHSHSQIIATPIIPKNIDTEINQCRDYFNEYERNLLNDEIDFEKKEGKRVVLESEHFIVYAPFASFFSFELRIVPKFQSSNFEGIDDALLRELSSIFKIIMKKLDIALSDPSLNIGIITAPPKRSHKNPHYFHKIEEFFRWHIDIIPRTSMVAGFELFSGYYINSIPPEDSAKFLKNR